MQHESECKPIHDDYGKYMQISIINLYSYIYHIYIYIYIYINIDFKNLVRKILLNSRLSFKKIHNIIDCHMPQGYFKFIMNFFYDN